MSTASPEGRSTLSDVATLAGVSLATASKALRGQPRVGPATRERVLQAAQQLAYQPNHAAQSLVLGRSRTIGLITSDLQGRFSTPILVGAEDALGRHSTSVLLSNARGDADLEREHVQTLLSRNVDGLIVVNAETNPRPSLALSSPVPVVYAYAPSTDAEDASVTCDNRGAGRLAVEHLLALGRRRIALIGGARSYAASRDRAAGARQALKAAGLAPCGSVRFGDWSEAWGRQAMQHLLEEDAEVDAVVCQSDQIARGCLDVLHFAGRRVPEDVAVIGHDNWDVIAEGTQPGLTSIDNECEQIGRRAAAMLVEAMGGAAHHGVELVPCRLVPRGSTAPA
ncbi:LacI family DNA-binding transcriptional regulator [Kineococcus vitellinus]|uniref:LacI family DNA-binding transcriptional regulator n=1 Tax=Kineococcus vitellinus TaxID=2696565 RepID=UPI001F0FAA6B|nr:LacI family DNA-binding transcriptional regulator [Kineococcus vitellinus]